MKQKVTSQQKNSKQSGFTLIELVIVIIILGILAATAVPKFMNLKGDAVAGTLDGVKTALIGAGNITYARAAMAGSEAVATAKLRDGLDIVYGYPAATSAAINTVADLAADWTVSSADGIVTIIPASTTLDGTKCQVTYTQATAAGERPAIAVDKDCN